MTPDEIYLEMRRHRDRHDTQAGWLIPALIVGVLALWTFWAVT